MSAALQAALAGEVTAIAFCWKLTRSDGVILGFTSHDRALRLEGLTYQAKPGMTPSAVSTSAGFEPDSMAVAGALSAAAVRAADLDMGRWDGARVELTCCDWSMPEVGSMLLMRGYIGDVTRMERGGMPGSGDYSVELVSEMVKLVRGGPPRCSPICRAELGDARCRVDMAGRTMLAVVVEGVADRLIVADPLFEPEAYSAGTVRFLTGPLAGIERQIATVSDGMEIVLEQDLWAAGADGEKVQLQQGCDKRFETCVERFGNGLAFDGEPHVPGSDALVRYGEG